MKKSRSFLFGVLLWCLSFCLPVWSPALEPVDQPFQAHFENEGLDVNLCWPTRPGALYRVETSENLTDFTPTTISRYGNGGMQRVHVYSHPPPVPPVPDPNAPPPDLRPVDFLYFTVNPFTPAQTAPFGLSGYHTLFTWHQRATPDEPAQVCRVLLPTNFAEIQVGETSDVGRFPTFLFYYNVDPANTHKLHYDFSTWASPFQASYLSYTLANLSPAAAAVIGRLDPHLTAIREQASDVLGNQATAQVPEPVPYVPGQRKFYRVIETRLDTDGDGLFDDEEMGEYNSDPYSYDTDGDGYSDGHEIDAGSDPGNAGQTPVNGGSEPALPEGEDEDGDGLSNEEEKRLGTNPRSKDTDNDGAWDGAEIHPTEKLLTFAPGMSGRYIDLEVAEGELVSVNNSGQVLYRTETTATPANTTEPGQKVYDYSLWDVADSSVKNLKATVGDEDEKEQISYYGISDGGILFGNAKRKSAHGDTYYEQAFKIEDGGEISWLVGEEPDPAPPTVPPVEFPGSGSEPFTYGRYSAEPLGMDRHKSVYASEWRDGISGNFPAGNPPPAKLVSRSLTVWGSGAGNYGAVEAYFFAPGGDEGIEITAGTLSALSPEGRSVSMQESVTWKTTKGPTLITEPAYEGGSYYTVGQIGLGKPIGFYYRKNTASTVDDGSIPNNSVMIKFPANGNPNNINVKAISDMAKEESTTEGNGFMNGPVVGGSYQGKASFWVNQNGKWERSEIKTASAEGPPMAPVMGWIAAVEDDGDMWVDDGAGGYSVWNGREMVLFTTLLEQSGMENTMDYLPKQITSKGLIGCDKAGSVRLLVPFEFITKDPASPHSLISTTGVGPTNQEPTVKLEPVTTAQVTVNGDSATVPVSGMIFDAIMDNVPSGAGADIAGIKIYVNDELDREINLTRETDGPATFWRNYPAKVSIPTQNISIPVGGVNSIRVVTLPNAAGVTGQAEIIVEFDETVTPGPQVGGYTRNYSLTFAAANSATAADTLVLRRGGETVDYTLTETGNETLLFKTPEGNDPQIEVQLLQPYAAVSNQVEALNCRILDSGSTVSVKGAGLQHPSCTESGENTGVFNYAEAMNGISVTFTSSYSLSKVMVETPKPNGGNFPFTLRTALGGDPQTDKLKIGTDEFDTVSIQGVNYPKLNETQKVIAYLVRDQTKTPVETELLYYDAVGATLKRKTIADEEADLLAKFTLNSEDLDLGALKSGHLTFVDHEGNPAEEVSRVSIQTLISLINGDTTVEIEDDSWQKIRVKLIGDPDDEGTKVRIQSSEIASDYFELMVNPGGDGKVAGLSEVSEGIYESEDKIVVYHSEDGIDTLSEEQWLALKELGYLAVHNLDEEAWEIIKNRKVDATSVNTQEHHLFPQSEKFQKRYAALFPKDFEIDDFCIVVDKRRHLKFSYWWNADLKDVMDDFFTGPDSSIPKAGLNVQDARAKIFEKVLDLSNPNSLCSKYRVNPFNPIRYKSRLTKSGQRSTGDVVAKMISKYGGPKLTDNANRAVKILRGLAAKTGKKGVTLARKHKAIGLVLGAWMLLNNSPEAAAAEFFDITPAGAAAMLEGQIQLRVAQDLWDPENSVDVAELLSGEVIKEGDPYWLAKVSPLGIVEWVAEGEIDYFVPTTTPGVVNIWVQFGAELREFEGIHSMRGELPIVGEPWPYD